MTRWTEARLQEYLAEQGYKKIDPEEDMEADLGPESNLQTKAQNWMDERGYPWVHDKSKKINKPGQILDLYCFLPKARIVIFEFKAKGKKMSPEQKETYLKLMQLGHEVYECKSYKKFLEIVKEPEEVEK